LRWERDHAIHFAVVNALPTRNKIVDGMKQALAEDNIRVVDIELNKSVYNPLDAIREQAPPICLRSDDGLQVQALSGNSADDAERAVMFIFGLEDTFDSPEHRDATLLAMNIQREKYRGIFRCAMVFWLRRYAVEIIANDAPDFWAWRSGVYNLDTERQELERISTFSLRESDKYANLSADEKIRRRNELRALLDEYESSSDADKPDILQMRGRLLERIGNINYSLQQYKQARDAYNRSLDIACEIGDQRGEGNALNNLGNVSLDFGDARKVIEYCEQALVIHREIGNRRGEGNALGNLGNVYLDFGDAHKTIEYCEQALAIDHEIGDRQGEGTDLSNLGSAYFVLGDARKAIEYCEQALAIDREIGDRHGEGVDLGSLGNAYFALDDAHKAIEYYEQALVIHREIGDRQNECTFLGNLGEVWRHLGEMDKAHAYCEEGLRLALDARNPLSTTWLAWQLSSVYADSGDLATAVALAAFASSRFQGMGYPQAQEVAQNLMRYQEQMGESSFRQALEQAEEVVSDIFRNLAGEQGAEMARDFSVSH